MSLKDTLSNKNIYRDSLFNNGSLDFSLILRLCSPCITAYKTKILQHLKEWRPLASLNLYNIHLFNFVCLLSRCVVGSKERTPPHLLEICVESFMCPFGILSTMKWNWFWILWSPKANEIESKLGWFQARWASRVAECGSLQYKVGTNAIACP